LAAADRLQVVCERVSLAFGKSGLEVNIPEGSHVTVVKSTFAAALPDPVGGITN
jgi:hypothetical protein